MDKYSPEICAMPEKHIFYTIVERGQVVFR